MKHRPHTRRVSRLEQILAITASPTGAWRDEALCAQIDAEIFFPDKGASTREPKRICGMCNVRLECLQYALDNQERHGIWGGLSERERRKLEKPKSAPSAPAALSSFELSPGRQHGTRSGYVGGCRCRACRAAEAHYMRNRYLRRGNGGVA